eukprot:38800-Amphidinium_carterae.1
MKQGNSHGRHDVKVNIYPSQQHVTEVIHCHHEVEDMAMKMDIACSEQHGQVNPPPGTRKARSKFSHCLVEH